MTGATMLPAGTTVLRTGGGRVSVRISRRTTVGVLGLSLFVVAIGALAVTLGEYPISIGQEQSYPSEPRTWLGTSWLAAIYDRALTEAELQALLYQWLRWLLFWFRFG